MLKPYERFMNMRLLRIAGGYSQNRLADLLGVNKGMISKWERRLSLPSMKHMIRLDEVLQAIEMEIDINEVSRYNNTEEPEKQKEDHESK